MTLPPIHIVGRKDASRLLNSHGDAFSHVIAIIDMEDKPLSIMKKLPGKTLALKFEDVLVPSRGGRAPRKDDIVRMLKLCEDLKPEGRLLVHCALGISRSSAAALAIISSRFHPRGYPLKSSDSRTSGSSSSELEEAAQKSVEALLNIKKLVHPNARMVGFIDEILGYDGFLKKACDEHFDKIELVLP